MNIAILGTGNMGKAIIAGIRQKYGNDVRITAYDKNAEALKNLDSAVVVAAPAEWFAGSAGPDAIIIAVKPFDMASALAPVIEKGGSKILKPLWISIMAGKSIASLASLFPAGARLCRVMPNTPALIGEGMSAYALSENAAEEDAKRVETIFGACGKTIAVQEKFMNAVTGLSGSGPAYVFYFIESLIEAGVLAGLPKEIARECAVQTVLGASKMAQLSPEGVADLKMKVMTPAGTTASAFMVLEQHGFKDAIIKAVVAATKRSEELEK
jgi:pyrroline-5-carboxylate reductase